MLKKSFLIFFLLSFSAFSSEQDKQEFIDILNSNPEFYNKVELGMGFQGEMLSRQVDENGTYQNCTIAMRGQAIVINTTHDKDLVYIYQNHWLDINIEPGNSCDPTMYQTGTLNRLVATDKRRDTRKVVIFVSKAEVKVKKTGDKIFIVKYTIPASENHDEFDAVDTYNLNHPLFLNPHSKGFKPQYFEYRGIDLSSIKLCPPMDGSSDDPCIEDQDLSYLSLDHN